MYAPPFCPNRSCDYHIDPLSGKTAVLRRRRWFKHNGSYPTKVRGAVRRFKCLRCGRGFSEQTFSLDYYVKRSISYGTLAGLLRSCSGVRATARLLGCSCDSVSNRHSRLARQCLSAHSRLLTRLPLAEPVVADGFESFAVSQYFPNNIHLLAGAHSQMLYFCDYVTIRRSGRMTELQKRLRAALEQLFRPPAGALIASFTELLEHLHRRARAPAAARLVLCTDRKQEYRRALRAHPGLSHEAADDTFEHVRIDSRAARTRSNPLFAVNYLDRELRKDLAEHVRETVRYARNVNHSMERLWIYLLDHNLAKRFRINDPVALQRTHASEAGASAADIRWATTQLTTRRRFHSFEQLEPAAERLWRRAYDTPLKGVVKAALREIKREAARGAVQLQRVCQKLEVARLVNNAPQYLPKYAYA
jgi:transposase-like protein